MLTCQKQPICTGKKCAGRKNPDKELENKIQEIRHQHKDYGYRRMTGELKNQGFCVNKKKVQRIMQNLKLQATVFTRRSRKDSSYKGTVGTIALNRMALNLKIFLRMRHREVKFTFPIRTAPSNGLRTNVIMACCVNIYQKEYPLHDTVKKTSYILLMRSTPVRAAFSGIGLPMKFLMSFLIRCALLKVVLNKIFVQFELVIYVTI